MIIEKFYIEPHIVKNKIEYGKKGYSVQNACKCGCSPHPFIYICDGIFGINLKFETEEELNTFKKAVSNLRLTPPFRSGITVESKFGESWESLGFSKEDGTFF